MASGKVARRTVVADVAAILDSPELAELVAELDNNGGETRGRKGFGAKALLGACLIKSLYALPTWTLAAALIAEHPGLQDAIGGCPSVWACYRFANKLRENRPALNACLDACAASLREQNPDLGRDLAIDSSNMEAFANGHRFLRKDGPVRERYSDPDASWGHRSAISTRGAGSFYGSKLHLAVCTPTGLPLAWHVETARRSDSLYSAPLIDAVQARGFRAETCAMDKGYDNERVYVECVERACRAIIPLRRSTRDDQPVLIPPDGRRMSPFVPRGSRRFRELYARRGAVEREFGRLKHEYGLTPLRVRGLERVQLHADLCVLARLALALHRTELLAVAA
jgi:Transposase DDE domain